MSVPDIVRNVTKNVREALSSREEFKEKTTKDLPLYVLQSALSGVGQALQFGGRVKDRIRRLAGQGRDEETDTTETTEQATGETPADKPARREPVIFAPRPSQEKSEEVREAAEAVEPRAEANGAKARPEPVIFTPAKPATAKAPAETPAETPESPAETPAAAVTETAEAPATPSTEIPAETPEAAEIPVAEASAVKPGAEPETTTPEVPEVQVTEESALAEPMPGYSTLTIASLRARMRGKSAEQIGDLLAYERATSDRPEVVRMYENRLAKLRAAE
ncbi:hypothetical protein [Streptosporangium saharense]|uniref:hypothetical protein n=1 Tax=Streptosporangium saharense TaxID=1706840 RepID=UPI0034443D9A